MTDWGSLTRENAPAVIWSGCQAKAEDMPPDSWLLDHVGEGKRLLDLGAGVGRNSRAFAAKFWTVVAYDLPNMVSIMGELYLPGNVMLTDRWETALEQGPYDVVVISLVLQHLTPEEIHRYLADSVKLAPRLLLHSRNSIDGNAGAVLPFLEEYCTVVQIEWRHPEDPHFYAEAVPK